MFILLHEISVLWNEIMYSKANFLRYTKGECLWHGKIRKETENTSFLHCFLQNAQIING